MSILEAVSNGTEHNNGTRCILYPHKIPRSSISQLGHKRKQNTISVLLSPDFLVDDDDSATVVLASYSGNTLAHCAAALTTATINPSHNATQRDSPPFQRDNGFAIRGDVAKLLAGTRSLLQELGLEVDDHDAVEPMEEEEEGDAVPPRSPFHRQENGDLLDGAPSLLQQASQAPSPFLRGQAPPEKLPSKSTVWRGGVGDAEPPAPTPVGADTQPPPARAERAPAAAAEEFEAGDAMDVP